jgi:hypothetical protein
MIEDCKVTEAELRQAKGQLNAADGIIKHRGEMIENLSLRVTNYELQQFNLNAQMSLHEETIKALNLSLRKQKRKTTTIIIAGAVVVGGLTYLLITK